MEFIKQLNDVQQAAVKATEGPVLIIAGAGSGKTKVLTFRVAYLLENGVKPENILAVTFTNKAAQEMKSRIASLTKELTQPFIGTFHGFAVSVLKKNSYPYPRFSIYDASDQSKLIKEALSELRISGSEYKPSLFKEIISRAKNELLEPSEYALSAKTSFEKKAAAQVYDLYQKKLSANQALDFDDLLMRIVELFRRNHPALEKHQDRFKYILVDEYQDTNTAQYELIRLLSQKHKNICVVGDIDQAIYGWRGADFRNILKFETDYPETKVFKLEQNYRSTKNILSAAQTIIEKNVLRKPKMLWTDKPGGEKLKIFVFEKASQEAAFVIDEVKRLLGLGFNLADCAVLYRTNAQSRAFEEACLGSGMPYKVVGAFRFYERKEIKDVLSYLKVIIQPKDILAWKRIINVPPRNLPKLSEVFWEKAQKEGVSGELTSVLKGPKKEAFLNFLRLVESLKDKSFSLKLSDLVKEIADKTGYLERLSGKSWEEQERIENINELISIAKQFDDHKSEAAEKFLDSVALIQDADTLSDDKNSLNLMTMHAVKGLEFKAVFVCGLEEGIFPHSRADSKEELEEERRLCYVALTRAKEKIYLSCVRQRNLFGSYNESIPSRFLLEMPAELVEVQGEVWDEDGISIQLD
ncbi:ATP-dependent DNA helicase PcrA [Candidatus Parcubacteria bacterium]|nr:MAG: ATP-dependent DNA helicase PcrA [Candidatus Parcubacteria bacterium]